jgi:succinate-semialdehyde dehydrogenase/glutarate-semialdehyde dehydrogenase
MTIDSVNPFDNQLLASYALWNDRQIEESLDLAYSTFLSWSEFPISRRCDLLRNTAAVLRQKKEELARLITMEMGKLIRESRGEIEKCALVCDYYADNTEAFLADELVQTEARKSLIAYQPLGTVLAVMPWNFPFWQVFRFAAPALAAGNTALLRHSSNVPQCACAIEKVFQEAGAPTGVFQTLLVSTSKVEQIIADRRTRAVTFTGSENVGRKIAATSGAHIKKTVLELGGSDAFIVLEDADLKNTVKQAVASRFLNCGQSCIAAKRFILAPKIASSFMDMFQAEVESLTPGDPINETTTLAPMARRVLRDEIHAQVETSLQQGATAVTGCRPLADQQGAFYAPSILSHVRKGNLAYHEELFGPVAIVLEAKTEKDAAELANDTPFGLGASIWTADIVRAEKLARKIQAGSCFINSIVKSDPRLPFGGVKASGYGRELSVHGMREFLNIQTIYINA